MNDAKVDDFLDGLNLERSVSADFGTEMQIELDGVSSRLKTQFVGMEEGKYLIVKTPGAGPLGGIAVKLFAGNRVVVRYVHRGSVFGFETTIIDSLNSPACLLFLAYPKVVTERGIRSNPRVHTSLPARIGSGEAVNTGTITDISISGCQLEARISSGSMSVNPETDISFAVKLPGISGDLELKGTIRSAEKGEKSVRLGIQFSELAEDVQSAISEYIESFV